MLIASFATYLKYFSDVVSLKSFSKAAKRNFISQSAMSQAIKKLEERTGHQLIYHSRNTLNVTPEGKLLFAKIQGLMDHFDSLEVFFEELKNEKIKKVHFGCMHSIALSILPKVIRTFKRRYTQSEISFELGNGAYIRRLVAQGEVDFGIVIDYDDLEIFFTQELHRGHYEVYRSKKCMSDKLMISDQSNESKLFIKNYISSFNRSPEIEMKVASWEVIARLTEMGIGCGYFPDYLTYYYKLVEPMKYPFPSIAYSLVALFKSKCHATSHTDVFLDVLLDQLVSN